jgi:ABC-type transport system involved in multi-copper enzyme maturation permease subunit
MMMLDPRVGGSMPLSPWPLNCGVMLTASAAILLVSVARVRKVALSQIGGQLGVARRKRRPVKNAGETSSIRPDRTARIRPVKGPPVLWKELRLPILGRRKIGTCIVIGLGLIAVVATYYLCWREHILGDRDVHISYALIGLGLGLLSTVVLSATCITSEKEAQSWPLLLATTLDDRAILFGKWAGVVRRCLPAWVWLLVHVTAFSIAGFIHPIAILQIVLLGMWSLVFLSGSGLYFSSCFKRTTPAVTMNFALAIMLWAILPILMGMAGAFLDDIRPLVETYMDTNPFVHVITILQATVGRLRVYRWCCLGSRNEMNVLESTIWILECTAGYTLLGFLFAWRAKCRFRRRIF